MPAVVLLVAGPPMPDRSKVMAKMKGDTLVLQVGGCAWGLRPNPLNEHRLRKPQRCLGWDRQIDDDLAIRTKRRTPFRGMHCGCWGYEDGGDELEIETKGGIF